MRTILFGACALILAGCGTTNHSSPDQSRLEGRGETLRSLVDAEWARTKDRIKAGEQVPPIQALRVGGGTRAHPLICPFSEAPPPPSHAAP